MSCLKGRLMLVLQYYVLVLLMIKSFRSKLEGLGSGFVPMQMLQLKDIHVLIGIDNNY